MPRDLMRSNGNERLVFLLSFGLAAAFIFLIFGPAVAKAQSIQEVMEVYTPRQTNSLSGKVLDTAGEPLDGVKVERIPGTSNQTADSVVTDDKGRFELKTVPDGKYVIRLSRGGFKTLVLRNVVVENKYKDNLTITMEIGIY